MYIIAVIQKGQKVATKRKPPEHFAERLRGRRCLRLTLISFLLYLPCLKCRLTSLLDGVTSLYSYRAKKILLRLFFIAKNDIIFSKCELFFLFNACTFESMYYACI